jgi:hypothetical protein
MPEQEDVGKGGGASPPQLQADQIIVWAGSITLVRAPGRGRGRRGFCGLVGYTKKPRPAMGRRIGKRIHCRRFGRTLQRAWSRAAWTSGRCKRPVIMRCFAT